MLRPDIESHFPSVAWGDLLPALEAIQEADMFQGLTDNPGEFLDHLYAAAGHQNDASPWLLDAKTKLHLAKLRPKLTPLLIEKDLEFSVVRQAVDHGKIKLEDLHNAQRNPTRFVDRLIKVQEIKRQMSVSVYEIGGEARKRRSSRRPSTAAVASVSNASAAGGGGSLQGITMPGVGMSDLPDLGLQEITIPDFELLEQVQEVFQYIIEIISGTKTRILISLLQVCSRRAEGPPGVTSIVQDLLLTPRLSVRLSLLRLPNLLASCTRSVTRDSMTTPFLTSVQ
jgi:hypothetical protein